MVASQGDRLEREQSQMKKDLAEVKAYAEATADSNRARDAYVDKEQDKFFRRINRQRADIVRVEGEGVGTGERIVISAFGQHGG